MPTISKAHTVEVTESISQGDIFRNVKYTTIIDETNEYVDVKEFTYPYAIIVSQGCDVFWMNDLFSNKTGSSTKVMPMVLLCPLYHFESVKSGDFVLSLLESENINVEPGNKLMYFGEDRKIAAQDLHYRFHKFQVKYNDKDMFKDYVIDFKQCFTVPFSYLDKNRDNRLFALNNQYAQQITQKFCNFVSRIGFE